MEVKKMKIAIITDSHDNIDYFKKFVEMVKQQKIDTVIHCGDLVAPFMIQFLVESDLTFYLTSGNNTGDLDMLWPRLKGTKINYYPRLGEIELAGKKIAFTHFPDFAELMAASGKYDYVFYGHTHIKVDKKIGNTLLINPGELTNLRTKGSFVILDLESGKYEFIDLN